MSSHPVQLSPPATIDQTVNPYDYTAVITSRDEFFKEQLVNSQEAFILRDKLRWCYMRSGVNHFQTCRDLASQYMEVMRLTKGGSFVPYSTPKPSGTEIKSY
ncbi:hypothetical protein BASA62_009974 [Batrachochytrium salamandrivorans]|nr:hypothetical protein BASA62_009974 [Batrachochytrium salamandrivorans]